MASKKPSGLGRGLGALLGDDVLKAESTGSLYLPISQVESCSSQPRKHFDEASLAELADSIREHGIIQPLTVRKLASGYYQIIAGERRWRAARLAGLQEVPVIVMEADDRKAAELAFYSRATTDIEYAFPFTDWGELWGIADRTNYDLSRHQEASGKSLEYFDSETNEHYIPYVIEPSLGCDRVALAFLCEAYDEEHLTDSKGKEDIRTVLHLHPALAPYKCAVLPLSKKLGDKAMEIRNELSKYFMVDYDDTGSIGKRYRREDEIGTPYCITVDFDTVGDEAKGIAADNCVTVRDRDTMEQVRMPISELKSYIESKIEF